MSERAHVIIIGGGPAGASAAILCRSFGLRVALIEALEFPRVAPGEALPCGIDYYFDQLGVTERVLEKNLPYSGTRMQWGDESFVAGFGEDESGIRRQGLQIPREHLDTVLLERARELGVAVLQPCVVKGLFARGRRIAGVVTDRGQFAADFIVDAAGSRHWMARKLRLAIKYHSPHLHGYYGWARGHLPDREDMPAIVADPAGWTWTSRVAEDLFQYTRLTFEKESHESSWLPAEFAGLTPTSRVRGADLTWRRVLHPAGPGFFLAGDALCRTDPVVQQGVFKSMVCGFKVALTLNQMFNQDVDHDEARQQFCDWVEGYYLSDLALLKSYYTRHPQAPAWVQNMEIDRVEFAEGPLVRV